ncbi:hypothetical protein [Mesomycoplasma hyopneumoniae]|uniref:hypothetical protein n=1 Tax=Mesomycoplasma hyopneumoniae TaxID=2099 RepID=UPI0002F701E6|nr:hypothetical protein [Mesomycoplasma hyopneumoniae]
MKYYKISEIVDLEAVSQKFIRREIARKTLISIKKNNKYLVSEFDYQKWKSSYRKQEKLRKNLGKTKEKVHFIEISEEMKKWRNLMAGAQVITMVIILSIFFRVLAAFLVVLLWRDFCPWQV